jgi:hypothetical protein
MLRARDNWSARRARAREGPVSTRLDAPYRSGPSKVWLKSKNPLSLGKKIFGAQKRFRNVSPLARLNPGACCVELL